MLPLRSISWPNIVTVSAFHEYLRLRKSFFVDDWAGTSRTTTMSK